MGDINPQIVCFGGNESIKLKKYLETIFICDIHPEIQWKKLKHFKMPHRMYFFGCVLFLDRIFIFGGKQKHSKGQGKVVDGLSDEIWILSLKNWKWSRCHLKCPKKAKYYAVKTDDDIVHLFEYEGNCGHWKIPISMLINQNSPKLASSYNGRHSLSKQVNTLSDKLTMINEENEELLQAQKEYKKKIKELKHENKELRQEIKELKKGKKEDKHKKDENEQIKQSLSKANANYNALDAKYKELQNKMNTINKKQNVESIMNANPFGDDSNPFEDNANPFGSTQDNNDYTFWGHNDISSWIEGLNGGQYRKYMNIVRGRLQQRNVDGHTFVNFQLRDLKNMGVTNYNDAVALFQQMQNLKNGQQQQSNSNQNRNIQQQNNNNNQSNATNDLFDSIFN